MPPRNNTRRVSILKATDGLFRNGLDHEVTIEDVARAAQISKGTVYIYFSDKEELFFQTEVYRMDQLVGTLREHVSGGLPFFDKILCVCHWLDEFFAERLPILTPQLWIRSQPGPETDKRKKEWRSVRRILREYLTEVVEQGIEEGAVRHDLSADAAARLLMALVRSRRMEMRGADERAPRMEDAVSIFLFGIANHSAKVQRAFARAEGEGGEGMKAEGKGQKQRVGQSR